MPDKKVAILIPSLMGGGAERVMVTLANEFFLRGFNVDLIVSRGGGAYSKEVNPGVRVVDFKKKRLLYSFFPIIQYMRKETPDAMLSALNSTNILAIIARIISGASFKLVVSERAVTSVALADNPLKRVKLVPFLMRLLYPKADLVVAVAQGVADDLLNTYKVPSHKVLVIYNPVVSRQLIEKSYESFNQKYFGSTPVIIAAGRLTSQKRFSVLLSAFAVLLKKRDANLVILGEGELEGELRKLAEKLCINDKVHFPGFVKNPFVWMKNASLFVLSSAYEGLPGVLIQAMACGTPVVSTDCPSGPKEILEGGKWGQLVPVDNVELLAKAMEETLSQEKYPDVTVRAKDFSVEVGVEKYMKGLGLI